MTFEVRGNQLYKNGKAIKIISGVVHYFRNMPDTWSDIFRKLSAPGCNCVETYCAWNMHEKSRGNIALIDIGYCGFYKKAADERLMVIVRPEPYICAEWGGRLLWWIQTDTNMEICCSNPAYINCFERYL